MNGLSLPYVDLKNILKILQPNIFIIHFSYQQKRTFSTVHWNMGLKLPLVFNILLLPERMMTL
jgi:hypothetical protein